MSWGSPREAGPNPFRKRLLWRRRGGKVPAGEIDQRGKLLGRRQEMDRSGLAHQPLPRSQRPVGNHGGANARPSPLQVDERIEQPCSVLRHQFEDKAAAGRLCDNLRQLRTRPGFPQPDARLGQLDAHRVCPAAGAFSDY